MPKAGNKRAAGNLGEAAVCEYLVQQGAEILCRNFTVRGGEIDIVARQGEYLLFVEVKTRRDRVPIEKIDNLTEKDYRPGGCTPLYDAMGQTLNRLEGLVAEGDKVMATIITDGYENSSEEYSGKTVKALVSRLREKGWVFAYIGANQDAVEVARDLNIANALNYDATPEGMVSMRFSFKKANRKMAEFVARCAEPQMYDKLFEDDDKA